MVIAVKQTVYLYALQTGRKAGQNSQILVKPISLYPVFLTCQLFCLPNKRKHAGLYLKKVPFHYAIQYQNKKRLQEI
jgi:hypothetical protein